MTDTVLTAESTVTDHHETTVLDGFLGFLADDLRRRPELTQAIDERLVHRIQSLVYDVDVDLDAPLSDKDE
ncbi:MAG: type II toxin-antitoxin system PrlF family antitoxin [Pseudomonadota bacterium]|jgi:antitoxin PrlF|uniref:type II toxin-antitoxin system PrlF family antitoxin n=1 Tax=Alloalcanivorax venustensis TaxID=172371 RepID=UPI000C3EFF98|nr:hypothetical protein [Alcanivorax sp.]MAL01348.1 hypothetical protein [Alcaligenaceae bacterium]MED5601810.1 type II toxin-antitoxin system PrlF family antitoxin [Pseudomonadota bacterium]QVL44162.1 MAG: type II toxin-antitoxin system PrlF family antitoxin [Alcanivorax sp.]|tara:strand:- start:337 stop:549 length:213 start_codon:yes stop_codon:yes gene_type:complete